VVATLGSRGSAAWDAGRLIVQPGFHAAVVDTTGAGDTFAGALAASLWQRRPFEEALRRANAAAAISCTRAGARGGMPRAADLDTWLES
jgi:ribokinase